MQHIWEAHAGKASPEVLPPQGLHTGSPSHAAGLLGPAFSLTLQGSREEAGNLFICFIFQQTFLQPSPFS